MTRPDWADALPRNWIAKPLHAVADYTISSIDKHVVEGEEAVRLCNYSDVYKHDAIDLSLDFMAGTATKDEIRRFRLMADDVLITKDSESWDDIGVPALVREAAHDLVCGYHLALIRPLGSSIAGSFLLRCLQALPIRLQLELAANGVTRFGIPKAQIGAMLVPVPPLSIQHAIADYLDRETARIDALIAAKGRLLELLAEKRRTIITHAVTRGLDPSTTLKDSGVQWLGGVPEHWRLVPLRFLVKLVSGATPNTATAEFWCGDIPWVSAKDMKCEEISDSEDHVEDAALAATGLKMIPVGAVLIVVRGMILAHSFPVAITSKSVTINQDLKALLCHQLLDPRFLRDYLQGTEPSILALADSSAHGTRKLETDVLGRVPVFLPPIHEQIAISKHLSAEKRMSHQIRAATEQSIALLKERRAALIAAAVIGQLPVGAEAARSGC